MSYIIFKNEDIVVFNKPSGVPSQADNSGLCDAVSIIRKELSEADEPSELYVVHRLDLVVGGLLVYARNKSTAARLSSVISGGEMGKEYLAVVEGECFGGEMLDYLYKNSAVGKSFVTEKGKQFSKIARLEYEVIESVRTEKGVRTLVKIKLHTGRFHQIRAQFSSRSHPLVGDGKYGSSDKTVRAPALFAYRISNITDDGLSFSALPDTQTYPWSLFSSEAYERC